MKQIRSYDVSKETLMNPPNGWSEGRVIYRGRPGEHVNTGTLSSDGLTLVIAATAAVVFVDTRGERPTRSWAKPAHAADLSNDGQWMVTARHNNPTTLRTANNAEAVMRFEINSVGRFSPDNRWLAVVNPQAVRLYSLSTLAALQERKDLQSLRPAYDPILLDTGAAITSAPLAFSPDSQTFAVVYNRTHVRLHETLTGRELATLSPPNPAQILGGRALAFGPDGQWLVAAKDDGESVAWNLLVIRAELAKLGLDWEVRQK